MSKIIEQKLFPDSETFVKDRPKSLTESQEEKFYMDMAEEIIKGGWSNDDKEDIVPDLKAIEFLSSGYEIAKDLETNGFCTYTFDIEFLEFLDNISFEKRERIMKNVEAWVKAHDIKPKFNLNDKLIVNSVNLPVDKNKVVYITGFRYETGRYVVNENPEKTNAGWLIDYEKIEENCTVIQ